MVYWLKNNWLLVCVIVGVLTFGIWEVIQSHNVTDVAITDNNAGLTNEVIPEEEIMIVSEDEKTKSKQFVDVKGEVKNPNMYEITGEERVKEVIELAGGFTEQANVESVNLAQRVMDEMVIVIPRIGDEEQTTLTTTAIESATIKIPLNKATKEEIETLPGIGAVKATAIIEYRTKNGPFSTIEDLQAISGIGTKTIEKLKEFIQIP